MSSSNAIDHIYNQRGISTSPKIKDSMITIRQFSNLIDFKAFLSIIKK